jgi:putative membrane protein
MWQRLSALPILAFVVLVEPLQAIAQQTQPPASQPWPGPWHMWGDGYGWWGGPFMMMFFWVFVIGAIVLVIMLLARGTQPMDRYHGDPTHSALQILSERFARGEIQKDEYEDRKATIIASARR